MWKHSSVSTAESHIHPASCLFWVPFLWVSSTSYWWRSLLLWLCLISKMNVLQSHGLMVRASGGWPRSSVNPPPSTVTRSTTRPRTCLRSGWSPCPTAPWSLHLTEKNHGLRNYKVCYRWLQHQRRHACVGSDEVFAQEKKNELMT